MTDTTLTVPRPLWRRAASGLGGFITTAWGYLMSFMPRGMTTKRVLHRMAWVTVMTFLTFNVTGYLSYGHWAQSWGVFALRGFPAIWFEEWLKVGAFVLWGATSLLIYSYILFHHSCKWRIGFGSFMLWRVLPVVVVSVLLWNPYFGYAAVGRDLLPIFFPETPWHKPWNLGAWDQAWFAGFALATCGGVAAWYYVIKKSWQGLGNSKIAALLLTGFIAIFLWFLKALGVFPHGVNGIITLLEFAWGCGMGFALSMAFVDRALTGTITAHTTADTDHRRRGEDGEVQHQHHAADHDAAAAQETAELIAIEEQQALEHQAAEQPPHR